MEKALVGMVGVSESILLGQCEKVHHKCCA